MNNLNFITEKKQITLNSNNAIRIENGITLVCSLPASIQYYKNVSLINISIPNINETIQKDINNKFDVIFSIRDNFMQFYKVIITIELNEGDYNQVQLLNEINKQLLYETSDNKLIENFNLYNNFDDPFHPNIFNNDKPFQLLLSSNYDPKSTLLFKSEINTIIKTKNDTNNIKEIIIIDINILPIEKSYLYLGMSNNKPLKVFATSAFNISPQNIDFTFPKIPSLIRFNAYNIKLTNAINNIGRDSSLLTSIYIDRDKNYTIFNNNEILLTSKELKYNFQDTFLNIEILDEDGYSLNVNEIPILMNLLFFNYPEQNLQN